MNKVISYCPPLYVEVGEIAVPIANFLLV